MTRSSPTVSPRFGRISSMSLRVSTIRRPPMVMWSGSSGGSKGSTPEPPHDLGEVGAVLLLVGRVAGELPGQVRVVGGLREHPQLLGALELGAAEAVDHLDALVERTCRRGTRRTPRASASRGRRRSGPSGLLGVGGGVSAARRASAARRKRAGEKVPPSSGSSPAGPISARRPGRPASVSMPGSYGMRAEQRHRGEPRERLGVGERVEPGLVRVAARCTTPSTRQPAAVEASRVSSVWLSVPEARAGRRRPRAGRAGPRARPCRRRRRRARARPPAASTTTRS